MLPKGAETEAGFEPARQVDQRTAADGAPAVRAVRLAPAVRDVRRPSLITLLTACGLLVIALVFQLTTAPTFSRYVGFRALEWERLKGFAHGNVPIMLELERGIFSAEGYSRSERAYAISKPFTLEAPIIELETTLAVLPEAVERVRIKVIGEQGQVLFDRPLSQLRHPIPLNGWAPTRLRLGEDHVGRTVSLRVVRESMPRMSSFVAVRDRMLLFGPESILNRTARPPRSSDILLVVAIVGAGIGAALLFSPRAVAVRGWKLYLLLFAAGFVIHYRVSSFLFWDEIYLLEQLTRKNGFRGVLYTHNEHFLPLFFTLFYGELSAFKDWYLPYLVVSFSIHAVNAFLLVRLLERIGGNDRQTRHAALIVGALFVVSSLHAETLQWAFEQSLMLQQLVAFGTTFAAFAYLESGRLRSLGAAAAGTLAAPLLFGNGFIVPLQTAFFVLLAHRKNGDGDAAARTSALTARRLISLAAACAAAIAAAALLYLSHRHGVGNGIDKARPFEDWVGVRDYLFVGSELGVTLRALGLFPFLATMDPETVLSRPGLPEPEMMLAWAGLAVTLFILLLSMAGETENRSRALRLVLLGKLLVVSSLLLPAFGRWQLGAIQSLSLRYHYATLVGFAMLVLPLIRRAIVARERGTLPVRTGIAVLLALHLFVQIIASRNYYVTFFGPRHRVYVEQLREWNTLLLDAMQGGGTSYEGTGTPLAGLQPLHVKSLTSERHPDEVYRALNWLSPARFPWNEEQRTPRRTDLD